MNIALALALVGLVLVGAAVVIMFLSLQSIASRSSLDPSDLAVRVQAELRDERFRDVKVIGETMKRPRVRRLVLLGEVAALNDTFDAFTIAWRIAGPAGQQIDGIWNEISVKGYTMDNRPLEGRR